MATDKSPWPNPQHVYHFRGRLNNPDELPIEQHFIVLAGASAPTITGGFAKVQNLDRPRRKGFSMAVGYDPLSMDLPVRFEAVTNYGYTPADVEDAIETLEWMAGRGLLYSPGTYPAHGNPPVVQVSAGPGASSSNLIPRTAHSDVTLRWLISNLQYDQNPIRNKVGDRMRQDVTVSLTEYVGPPGAPGTPNVGVPPSNSPSQRQGQRPGTGKAKTVTSTAAMNTIEKIAQAQGFHSPSQWTEIVNYNRDKLHVNSYLQSLKPGTKVLLPSTLGFNQA